MKATLSGRLRSRASRRVPRSREDHRGGSPITRSLMTSGTICLSATPTARNSSRRASISRSTNRAGSRCSAVMRRRPESQGRCGSVGGAFPAGRLQCAFQIFKQVGFRFETNGQPHQSIGDTGDASGFRSRSHVRHRRGMGNEAFDTAKRFSQRKQGKPFHEAPHGAYAARHPSRIVSRNGIRSE